MRLSFFWSEQFLLNRKMLWLLLWVNGLGTIYGFQWYGWQIVRTIENQATWLVLFVPDSPTASLFFTLAIVYLLRDRYSTYKERGTLGKLLRRLIEALALITSIKYGIWAVVMIVLGTVQGDAFEWQHGMLTVSHLGMALEAMLFARFFSFRFIHIIIVAIWTVCNDFIDYAYEVYPSLSFAGLNELLPAIKRFTISLSIACIVYAFISLSRRDKSRI